MYRDGCRVEGIAEGQSDQGSTTICVLGEMTEEEQVGQAVDAMHAHRQAGGPASASAALPPAI